MEETQQLQERIAGLEAECDRYKLAVARLTKQVPPSPTTHTRHVRPHAPARGPRATRRARPCSWDPQPTRYARAPASRPAPRGLLLARPARAARGHHRACCVPCAPPAFPAPRAIRLFAARHMLRYMLTAARGPSGVSDKVISGLISSERLKLKPFF